MPPAPKPIQSVVAENLKAGAQCQNNPMIEIKEFAPAYHKAVKELVLPIQQAEFAVPITLEEQPDLLDIVGTFQTGCGNFWVAMSNGQVIGCIGLVDIGNRQVALKKMFVNRDYRGKQLGVAHSLMAKARDWCKQKNIRAIFLGTTSQMRAAHRFYEKNGFVEIEPSELPPAFPIVHVDNKFYKCDLSAGSVL